MKHKDTTMKIASVLLCLLSITTGYAQHWRTSGNGALPAADAVTATSFVGTTNAFPLNLKTVQNQPMQFFTNNVQRLYIDNSAGGVNGNIGIGTMFNTSTRPFSNLHIQQDNNNLAFGGGFRPWMKPSAPGTYSGGGVI